MSSYVEGKDKNQILKEMYTTAHPGSVTHEQQKAGIIVRCTEDIEKALRETSESATTLSKKVYFLNWVLTIATIIGGIATALLAYKAFYP
jgi:hypothetical protein